MDTQQDIEHLSFLESRLLGSKYEKPLKMAFYNGIALLLFVACSVCTWGSFKILEPFLKPLLWALLCGSVLHPLKHKLSSHFKTWILYVESTDFSLPIVLELVSCPIKLFLDSSDTLGKLLQKHWIKLVGCVLAGILYGYIHHVIICVTWKILIIMMIMFDKSTDVFQNTTLMVTIVLAFIISITFCWDPKYEKQFLIASYATWFALSAHIASYFLFVKLPVFILFQMFFLTGVLLSYKSSSTTDSSSVSLSNASKCGEHTDCASMDDSFTNSKGKESANPSLTTKRPLETKNIEKNMLARMGLDANNTTSDLYIRWVSVACGLTLVLQSGWIPYVVALLLIVYAIRLLCKSFGVTDFISEKYTVFTNWLLEWYIVRKNVLIPTPIVRLNSLLIEIRAHLLSLLKESSDSAASVMVILALVFFAIFGTTFLVFQAYTEGVYMVKVGGSVINQTVVHNPELTQLLPDGWQHSLDSVLNNAYTYGRQALSKLVKNMLSGLSEEKTEELEQRALEVWDRVYQAWMMNAIEQKTTVGPTVTSSAVYQTWENFLDAMHKTPELVSMGALTKLAQENMATLTSGLESVWELVRGNASLVFSAFLTVLTVVFSHSFAVLNFCLSMIVFLSALFYLLSTSRELYKPVEMITVISPVFGCRLAFAMENAVKEVLTGSFKLSLFYGMWTWLIHSLFQMNIVYIPSVLAAMLAVVPVLGTYWACLPAVLDLWLAQGKNIHAIALAVCQFLPMLFVDATIYTEINEGHPYLTGLSVAGGLFCLGPEGAIMGPLVLCCLYVVVKMSSAVMHEPSTPASTPIHTATMPRALKLR